MLVLFIAIGVVMVVVFTARVQHVMKHISQQQYTLSSILSSSRHPCVLQFSHVIIDGVHQRHPRCPR